MLKKLLAFILLLNHLNTSMFLPQMAEVDMFDNAGTQIDDVNTLVEFIDQEVMGNYDNTPEDEDDDTEKPFHLIKIVDYSYHPYVQELNTKIVSTEKPQKVFTGYISPRPAQVFTSVIIPPPKA